MFLTEKEKLEKSFINLQLSGYTPDEAAELLNIEKSEGSRGGKIIGHTKSGKPIYDSFSHSEHKGLSTREHEEAGDLHHKEVKKLDNKLNGNITRGGYITERDKLKTDSKRKETKEKYDYHKEQMESHWKVAFANKDEKGNFKGHS